MKTIKRMMDHLYWADGRILDALNDQRMNYTQSLYRYGKNRAA